MTILNERILKLMSPADRAKLGKAGLLASEAEAKRVYKSEAELQGDIRQYLNLHEIEYINPPMNKKSGLPIGWPDFSLSYRGVAILIECKVEGEKPKPHQREMIEKLGNKKNAWVVIVAYSLAEVQHLMRAIDKIIDAAPKL